MRAAPQARASRPALRIKLWPQHRGTRGRNIGRGSATIVASKDTGHVSAGLLKRTVSPTIKHRCQGSPVSKVSRWLTRIPPCPRTSLLVPPTPLPHLMTSEMGAGWLHSSAICLDPKLWTPLRSVKRQKCIPHCLAGLQRLHSCRLSRGGLLKSHSTTLERHVTSCPTMMTSSLTDSWTHHCSSMR